MRPISLSLIACSLSAVLGCASAPRNPENTSVNYPAPLVPLATTPIEDRLERGASTEEVVAETDAGKTAEGRTIKTARNFRADRKPANHRWLDYRWAVTALPSTLKINDCLTSRDWKNHLMATAKDWNRPKDFGAESTPLENKVVPCAATPECYGINGATQVCNAEYGETGWLGYAAITITNNFITAGLALVNDTYFNMPVYNNRNERRHVMCQEVAHTFGLNHQSENGSSQNSCMDYYYNIGENAESELSTRPNAHDFEELNKIYDRTDGFTTLDETARRRRKKGEHEIKNWGRLLHQSKDGRGSTYESREADGTTVIRHVYWAKDAADEHHHDHD